MIRLFEDKSHVQAYSIYRPSWPEEVVTTAMAYLQKKKEENAPKTKEICDSLIDIGCGSGQSTPMYAEYCRQIIGLDASPEQIKIAKENNKFGNISYAVGIGGSIPFPDNSVEMICCAQSVHWLDWEKFFEECRRVLVPHGCMATYGYSTPRISFPEYGDEVAEKCNELFLAFYKSCPWHPRRKHIDNRLSLFYDALPCSEKLRNDEMKIVRKWNLEQFQGYVLSWSGYRKFMEEKGQIDVLSQLLDDFKRILGKPDEELKDIEVTVVWDIFMILSTRPDSTPEK